MPASRIFAVIPAAGRSRRMGQPKLLLPLGGKTVLARLIDALRRPEIAETVVVVRPDDDLVAHEARSAGAIVLQPPVDPPEMRDSVELALRYLQETSGPNLNDAWLLIPADHPVVDVDVLVALIARWQQDDCDLLLPKHAGRRGHPTIFRWGLANQLQDIPKDQGLNWLVRRNAQQVVELEVESPTVLMDLDTPADYQALLERYDGQKAD
jgi:molybdenum cofactor cytidylyltransferase